MTKPSHIQKRKDARRYIYGAVFGYGGKFNNVPWQDSTRQREQGWTQQSAWGIFEAYKDDAALPRHALIEIASSLGVRLEEVL